MLVSLPQLLQGTVVTQTTQYAREIKVSAAFYSNLQSLLNVGDTVYLTIEVSSDVEVIKVISLLGDDTLYVERGKEGRRVGILPKSLIYYVQTIAEVTERVNAGVPKLTLTGTGTVQINGFNVYIPEVIIQGRGVEVLSSSLIEPDESLHKCHAHTCGMEAVGPFYLTSKLYPVEVIEYFKSVASFVSAIEFLPPVDDFKSTATMLDGILRAVQQTISIEPDNFKSTATVLDGILRSVQITTSIPPDNFKSTATVLNGEIKNSLITYSNYPVDNFRSTASILDGTLA